MRNKTFISSMVGVAAAVSVAGSVNAAIVTGPNGPSSDCATFEGSTSTTITYTNFIDDSWDSPLTDFKIKTILYAGSTATVIPIGAIEYSYNSGSSWINYSLTSSSADNISTTLLSAGWGATITPSGVTVGVGNFRVRVTIPANALIVNGQIFKMSLNFNCDVGGSPSGGTPSRTSSVVPAPGALALLGVASAIGARRRRA